MAQFGFGLPLNTDIKFRYVPNISLFEGGGGVNMWGIGVLHDIKQHIPGIEHLPFQLSLFAGYTKLNLDAEFTDTQNSIGGSDQKGEYDVSSITAQVLVSKKNIGAYFLWRVWF